MLADAKTCCSMLLSVGITQMQLLSVGPQRMRLSGDFITPYHSSALLDSVSETGGRLFGRGEQQSDSLTV